MNAMFPRLLPGVLALWVALTGASSCWAKFELTAAPTGGFKDQPGGFRAEFKWDMPAGKDESGLYTSAWPTNEPRKGTCGTSGERCWSVDGMVGSTPVAGKRDLAISLSHFPGERPADAGHGPNGLAGRLDFKDLAKPTAARAPYKESKVASVAHENLTGPKHSDYFTARVELYPAGAEILNRINVEGIHVGDQFNSVAPSYRNNSNRPVRGVFVPSYPDPRNPFSAKPVVIEENAQEFEAPPGGRPIVGSPLPSHTFDLDGNPDTTDDRITLAPSNYQVKITGSPVTDTTLAFLGTSYGEKDTSGFTELEMAPFLEMFVGSNEFYAPDLREEVSTHDLYVFVNLTDWLTANPPFAPLEVFNFTHGVSESLPGIFVSLTPISVNSDGSFAGTPFDGPLQAFGTIDGHMIPEPSTFGILVVGAISLRLARPRRWRP